MVNSLFKHL